MEVRILRAYGDRYGRQHTPGDVAEFPDHIALKLIGNGTAAAVEPSVESATVAPPEKAARTTKPKTRK